ncbi:MAG: hypothetical protein ACQEW8_10720 [Actinomycetota bacterium]
MDNTMTTEILDRLDEQLRSVRKHADAKTDELRANPALTADWKVRQIARVWIDARENERAILHERSEAVDTIASQVERTAFGLTTSDPATVIAYRDAQDRADDLPETQNGEQKALRILDRAILSNDDTMTAAIVRRSLESNWGSVVSRYKSAYPSRAENLTALEEAKRMRVANDDEHMKSDMRQVMSKPRELINLPEHVIEQRAAES